MLSYQIYIPTLGREGMQATYERLKYLDPILVCPQRELHTKKALRMDFDGVGIGPKRQHILETCKADICVMIDDDMSFFHRDENMKLNPLTSATTMFQRILDLCERGFIHGGVSTRPGNNHVLEDTVYAGRMCSFMFFQPKKVLDLGVDFTRLPVMEDFDVTLYLLTRGYANAVIYDYAWNQKGSGSKGGCSLFRTKELQHEAATKLAETYPDFVTTVKRTTKGSGVFGGERTDVRIQWKKAFEYGKKKRFTVGGSKCM